MDYKVEILTATKDGLAAFLQEVKRARARHRFPVAEYEAFKKKAKEKKAVPSYDEMIDGLVTQDDQETKRAVIEHQARFEMYCAQRFAQLGAGKDFTVTVTPPAKSDENEKTAQEHIHSIRNYVGRLNRDVNEHRVEAYCKAIRRDEWWFTPDPIVVTDEGEIINGQHRLLAAEEEFASAEEAPRFVVVWGVDKRAALLMDEARRTATDRRDIALRFAAAK